jgi:hypothetical protein
LLVIKGLRASDTLAGYIGVKGHPTHLLVIKGLRLYKG